MYRFRFQVAVRAMVAVRASAALAIFGVGVLAFASSAQAGQETIVTDEFIGATPVDGNWLAGGAACLTASQNTTQKPIPGCAPGSVLLPLSGDAPGSGALRLTGNGTNQSGFVIYQQPVRSLSGMTVDFDTYAYNGNNINGTGGDGINFFLVKGTASPTQPGAFGGSLGYSASATVPGIEGGFAGLGIDEFGNYYRDINGAGVDCGTPHVNRQPNTVALRGPGVELSGYCVIGSHEVTGRPFANPTATKRTDPNIRIQVRVIVEDVRLKSARLRVLLNFGSGYVEALAVPMPSDPRDTLKFGFAASSGDATNVHEVQLRSVVVNDSPPRLRVTKSHQGNFVAGGTGDWTVQVRNEPDNPPVRVSGDLTAPVTVRDSLPRGVSLRARPSGSGWNCAGAAVGAHTFTCTYPVSSPLPAGTVLPPLAVPVKIAETVAAKLTNTVVVDSDDNANTAAESTGRDTVMVLGGLADTGDDPRQVAVAGASVALLGLVLVFTARLARRA